MKNIVRIFVVILTAALALTGCAGGSTAPSSAQEPAAPASTREQAASTPGQEPVTILAAAAASLESAYVQKLIPLFREKYPWITVEGTYDSSGKLQTQIEEGLEADIFMSAATKQMDALKERGLMDAGSIVPLLENKLVLIKPADGATSVKGFEDAAEADTIAIGDPESVPAGQYAREVFTSLGIWGQVSDKAALATNVTEVLNWVAEGSAGVGVVYATDAVLTDKVTVIANAPEGSLQQKIIYPVGITAGSKHKEAAMLFLEFLGSSEALEIFEAYGFAVNK